MAKKKAEVTPSPKAKTSKAAPQYAEWDPLAYQTPAKAKAPPKVKAPPKGKGPAAALSLAATGAAPVFPMCLNLPAGDRIEMAVFTQQQMSRHANSGAFSAMMAAVNWPRNSTLKVGFMNPGDPTIIAKVKAIAPTWSEFCSIEFAFDWGGRAAPDILVNTLPRQSQFGPLRQGVYQSFLGTQCPRFAQSGVPSMDLIFNTATADETEYRRVILHEFGHALGLIHEHTRPDRPIEWNQQAVIRYYQQITGWQPQQILQQVLQPYQGQTVGQTQFDPDSIMMYPFPPGLATYNNGAPFQSGWNNVLDAFDKQIVAQIYGPSKRPTTGPSGGGGGGDMGTIKELSLGTPVNDAINTPGASRRYSFVAPEVDIYTVSTTGATDALTGTVFGPDNSETKFSAIANRGDFINLFLKVMMPAGKYYLEIHPVGASATASYTLSVTKGF